MIEINLATEKQAVLDLKTALQKAKEEAQLAKAEKKAAYQLRVEETQVRLTEELSELCKDYCSITWDKALNVASVPTNST